MEAKRRIGKTDSKTRDKIVEVAEDLMLQCGYASVTSRKVALKADMSSKLVHYYFRSMDDLFLEVLDRSMRSYRRELQRIAKSERPLTELWAMNSRNRKSALAVQLMALATHSERVKIALTEFGDYFRRAQVEIIRNHLVLRRPDAAEMTPEVLAVVIECVARMMVFENQLDLSVGHQETRAVVQQYLASFEPPRSRPEN